MLACSRTILQVSSRIVPGCIRTYVANWHALYTRGRGATTHGVACGL